MNFEEMKRRLDGLVVFRELLRDEAVAMFRELLQDRCRNDADAFTAHCGDSCSACSSRGTAGQPISAAP